MCIAGFGVGENRKARTRKSLAIIEALRCSPRKIKRLAVGTRSNCIVDEGPNGYGRGAALRGSSLTTGSRERQPQPGSAASIA